MQIRTVGIDLAKHVFQIHGMDQDGNIVLRSSCAGPRSSVSSPATAVPGRHEGLWDVAPLGARDRDARP